jgi:hypothetical protein
MHSISNRNFEIHIFALLTFREKFQDVTQRVLIHLNRRPNEGVMAVLFPLLHGVQKFQTVQPSVIRPYPLVRTSD